MKKLKAALAALAAAICLAVPAFADIVVEPEPAGENLLLVLGLAVVAVVAAVLIAAFVRRQRQK